MHTKARVGLVGRTERLLSELRVDARAREVVQAATERQLAILGQSDLRHVFYRQRREEAASRTLTAAARDMVALALAGCTEAEVGRYPQFLGEVQVELFCGNAHRELGALDLEEVGLEAVEDQCTEELHVLGETPERLRAAAAADRREAALQIERANRRERRARELERQQGRPRLVTA